METETRWSRKSRYSTVQPEKTRTFALDSYKETRSTATGLLNPYRNREKKTQGGSLALGTREGEWNIWNFDIQNFMPKPLKGQISSENVWCGVSRDLSPKYVQMRGLQPLDETGWIRTFKRSISGQIQLRANFSMRDLERHWWRAKINWLVETNLNSQN